MLKLKIQLAIPNLYYGWRTHAKKKQFLYNYVDENRSKMRKNLLIYVKSKIQLAELDHLWLENPWDE